MRGLNIEMKAKANSLEGLHKFLSNLKAEHIGVFNQVDTYFNVSHGRLKLRETLNSGRGELVYYERRNVEGPKLSSVYTVEIPEPAVTKMILEKVLGVWVIVDKTREVFRYAGVKVHLDTVKGLGNFLELEKQIENWEAEARKSKRLIKDLMKKMGISRRDLQRGSYSDLILQRKRR